MPDSDILQIIDNLTSFGILALVVLGFARGWVIPTPMQTKIDLMRENFDADRVAQSALHELEVQKLLERHALLQDRYREDLGGLYQKRISDLEQLLLEREARVEQGLQMIAGFTQTQDSLSTLADIVRDR